MTKSAPKKSLTPTIPGLPTGGRMGMLVKAATFLAKRPSDTSIRMLRIMYGLVVLGFLAYSFGDFSVWVGASLASYEIYFRSMLAIFGILPIVIGVTGVCITRRKYFRVMESVFGLLLVIIGNIGIIESVSIEIENMPMDSLSTPLTGTDYNAIVGTTPVAVASAPVSSTGSVGFWLAWLGILPILTGASGKMVTQKCWKYGEKITKIRV